MKRDSPTSPFKVSNVAAPKMIVRFNVKGIGGPSTEDFQLDLMGKVSSKWNKRAAVIFRRHFLDSNLYGAADPTEIEQRFLTHLKTLIAQFARKRRADGADDSEDGMQAGDETMHARRQRRYGVRGFGPLIKHTLAQRFTSISCRFVDFKYAKRFLPCNVFPLC